MELLDGGLESALAHGVNEAVCSDETSVGVLSDVSSCYNYMTSNCKTIA